MKTFKFCLCLVALLLLTTCRAFADDLYEWRDTGWVLSAVPSTTVSGAHAGESFDNSSNPLLLNAWGGNPPGSQGPFAFGFISAGFDRTFTLYKNGSLAGSNPGINLNVLIQGMVSVSSDAYGSGSGGCSCTSGPSGATLSSFSSGTQTGVYGSGAQTIASYSGSGLAVVSFHISVNASATGDASTVTSIYTTVTSP